jgi:hypothetical protein
MPTARRHNNTNEYLVKWFGVWVVGCMASGYVSNKSTFYSCKTKQNIHSKPHDELIQVHHKPFDAKSAGLTELLQDPEHHRRSLKETGKKSAAHFDTKRRHQDRDLEKLMLREA